MCWYICLWQLRGKPSHCKQHTSSCSRWFNALLVGLHKKHHGCCVCPEKILTLCIRYIAGRPRQQEMKVVYWWAIQYMSFRFIYGPHDFEVIHCDLVGHWLSHFVGLELCETLPECLGEFRQGQMHFRFSQYRGWIFFKLWVMKILLELIVFTF